MTNNTLNGQFSIGNLLSNLPELSLDQFSSNDLMQQIIRLVSHSRLNPLENYDFVNREQLTKSTAMMLASQNRNGFEAINNEAAYQEQTVNMAVRELSQSTYKKEFGNLNGLEIGTILNETARQGTLKQTDIDAYAEQNALRTLGDTAHMFSKLKESGKTYDELSEQEKSTLAELGNTLAQNVKEGDNLYGLSKADLQGMDENGNYNKDLYDKLDKLGDIIQGSYEKGKQPLQETSLSATLGAVSETKQFLADFTGLDSSVENIQEMIQTLVGDSRNIPSATKNIRDFFATILNKTNDVGATTVAYEQASMYANVYKSLGMSNENAGARAMDVAISYQEAKKQARDNGVYFDGNVALQEIGNTIANVEASTGTEFDQKTAALALTTGGNADIMKLGARFLDNDEALKGFLTDMGHPEYFDQYKSNIATAKQLDPKLIKGIIDHLPDDVKAAYTKERNAQMNKTIARDVMSNYFELEKVINDEDREAGRTMMVSNLRQSVNMYNDLGFNASDSKIDDAVKANNLTTSQIDSINTLVQEYKDDEAGLAVALDEFATEQGISLNAVNAVRLGTYREVSRDQYDAGKNLMRVLEAEGLDVNEMTDAEVVDFIKNNSDKFDTSTLRTLQKSFTNAKGERQGSATLNAMFDYYSNEKGINIGNKIDSSTMQITEFEQGAIAVGKQTEDTERINRIAFSEEGIKSKMLREVEDDDLKNAKGETELDGKYIETYENPIAKLEKYDTSSWTGSKSEYEQAIKNKILRDYEANLTANGESRVDIKEKLNAASKTLDNLKAGDQMQITGANGYTQDITMNDGQMIVATNKVSADDAQAVIFNSLAASIRDLVDTLKKQANL